MSAGFFVTGTDTDVGKTWATVALMRWFQGRGLVTLGMKPVAAGCEWQDGVLKNADALLIQKHGSLPMGYQEINPYAFADAVSPHLACGDIEVREELILQAYTQLQQKSDVVLVEGAGGWYSPLGLTMDNASLARRLDLPVILVVGVRLGCINHARLTQSAIRQAGLTCAGWVAVQIVEQMPGFDGNLAYLSEAIDAPLLGVLPHLAVADFDYLAEKLTVPNW